MSHTLKPRFEKLSALKAVTLYKRILGVTTAVNPSLQPGDADNFSLGFSAPLYLIHGIKYCHFARLKARKLQLISFWRAI